MLARQDGTGPLEVPKDEFQELSEMFNNAELETVRKFGGMMHRERSDDQDDSSSYHRPRLLIKDPGSGDDFEKASPVSATQPTFESHLSHKEKQEQEMERLYAAVFQNETKAPKEISIKEQEVGGPGHTRNLSNASKRSFSQRRPPQLAEQTSAEPAPISPRSFASSHKQGGYPASANSRYSAQSDASSIKSRNTSASAAAQQSRPSRSKNTRSLRNLTISAPMPTNKYPGV